MLTVSVLIGFLGLVEFFDGVAFIMQRHLPYRFFQNLLVLKSGGGVIGPIRCHRFLYLTELICHFHFCDG